MKPPRLDLLSLLEELVERGLFDPAWYHKQNEDVRNSKLVPLDHFAAHGLLEKRRPNAHFDCEWYLRSNPDATNDLHPVIHYLRVGEAHGKRPVPYFDPEWYRQKYLGAFDEINALGHYLQSRATNQFDPNPYFCTGFYLRMNPDVAASGYDALEHFLSVGYREGRNPSSNFDLRYYQRRYLRGNTETNPLLHYLEIGARAGYATHPADDPFPASEVRRFTAPAPEFEELQPHITANRTPRAKLVAFYLPQFHPFPENDEWWGLGFTEWTNVSRATPRFAGHYQPRIPRDFGFYDLRNPEVMSRQIHAAVAAGIHGFCFYYYNFDGKRLLDRPVEAFLNNPDLEMPFCLMWANENWTRRWDGSETELLIRQGYRLEDDERLVADLARHFRDPRYIRLEGQPLLVIYRAGIIPDAHETITRWRSLFLKNHGECPLIFMAQTFSDQDPSVFGCDGAIEFPPHRIVSNVNPINSTLDFFDYSFSGIVYNYDQVVGASLEVERPNYPLIKTVFPNWDNDARRQGRGVIVTGSTPAKYRDWLAGAIQYARTNPTFSESFVFINAWNEWAEGAYLEPDIHYGGAYLNATARAAIGMGRGQAKYPVLLIGSDNMSEESRRTFLEIVDVCQRQFGCNIQTMIVTGGGTGRVASELRSKTVVEDPGQLEGIVQQFADEGFSAAIVISVAAGQAVRPLKAAGLRVVSIVDVLPTTVGGRQHIARAREIAVNGDVVVAPYPSVLESFERAFGKIAGRSVIRALEPPSLPHTTTTTRSTLRRSLGLSASTKLIVNSGPATIQAGADLFASVATLVTSKRNSAAFVWFGDIDPEMRIWLERASSGRVLFRSKGRSRSETEVAASDILAFTAREDAQPTVLAQALSIGMPVVAFEGAGSGADLIKDKKHGRLVAFGDVAAMADEILRVIDDPLPARRTRRSASDGASLPRERYVMELLQDANPSLKRVSVALLGGPNESSTKESLINVFDQTYPVFETIVVDGSAPAKHRSIEVAAAAGRDVKGATIFASSTSPAEVLSHIIEKTSGDLLWVIAPNALADPSLLETLVRAFEDESVIFAACEATMPESEDEVGSSRSLRSRAASLTSVEDAATFAKTRLAHRQPSLDFGAVVWRRTALTATLDAITRSNQSTDQQTLLLEACKLGGSVGVFGQALVRQRRSREVRLPALTAEAPNSNHGQEEQNEERDVRPPDAVFIEKPSAAAQAAADAPFGGKPRPQIRRKRK